MHREDIKAAIRKAFGTLSAFERANDLPSKSVNDVLRGRTSARVQRAIDNLVEGGADVRRGVDNYTPNSRHGKSA